MSSRLFLIRQNCDFCWRSDSCWIAWWVHQLCQHWQHNIWVGPLQTTNACVGVGIASVGSLSPRSLWPRIISWPSLQPIYYIRICLLGVVGIVNRLWAGWSEVWCLGGARDFCLLQSDQKALSDQTALLFSEYPWVLPRVNRAGARISPLRLT